MPIELDDRGRALENEYFRQREKELLEKMRAKVGDAAPSNALDCPKCDGKLIETNFENIKIDVCNKCTGVFLDAGELAQIAHKDEDKGWFGRVFS